MNMMHTQSNPLSPLRLIAAAAQSDAPSKGALQSTWGITRGRRRELSGSQHYPTERRQPDE